MIRTYQGGQLGVVYLDVDLGLGREFGYRDPARVPLIEDMRPLLPSRQEGEPMTEPAPQLHGGEMSGFRIANAGRHNCADDLRNAEHAYKRITRGAIVWCSCGKPWKLRHRGSLLALFRPVRHGSYQNDDCVWVKCSQRTAWRVEAEAAQADR